MASKLLEINHLKVSFDTPSGTVNAVNDISYTLDRGEVIGVVGESGSGKSVTASTIMGLVDKNGHVDSGSVIFNGKDVTKMGPDEIRKLRGSEVGMIFQDPMTSLNPVFTVGAQLREAVLINSSLSREEAGKRAKELLKLVSINDPDRRMKQYPFEFSGGMRQRVMIAMALAGNPKMLIADEPTTALDVTIQAQILEIIKDLKNKSGMAVMMITHDLGIVADIADKVVVMYGGRIVERAPCEDIFKYPVHPYTKGLLNSIPRLDSSSRLVPIDGTPVDLLHLPKGCPFAQRCNQCMKVCLNNMPPYTDISEGHKAACWLLDKRAKGGAAK